MVRVYTLFFCSFLILCAPAQSASRVIKGFGTGFFLSTDGVVVTNHHVIASGNRFEIYLPGSATTPARVLRTDPVNDVAILKADIQSKPIPITPSFTLNRGEEVLTLGYPAPTVQGAQQKATFGRINATSGVQDDVRFVQIDTPIQPGNSGGPLLNTRGEVVGIITAKLRGEFQNVNYALKVDYLHPLLSASPKLMKGVSENKSMSMTEIAEHFHDSVVMIISAQAEDDANITKFQAMTSDNLPEPTPEEVERYQKAAVQGDANAQNYLGRMYISGRGVPKDEYKAVEWFRKSAEQGFANAQNNLGNMYCDGRGVLKDDREAIGWYQKAADQGYAPAQNSLGRMYQDGRGVPQNEREAMEWYRKAADQGFARAQNNVGFIYHFGLGVPQDDRLAIKWYQKAADQGDAGGQNNLGVMYQLGRGVPKSWRKAMEWYRKAADQGLANAQCNLGIMYANGYGVPKDERKAVEWYQKAADQGFANAQGNLGLMYYSGQGVIRDRQKGCTLIRKAAEQKANEQQDTSQVFINLYNRYCNTK
jgi:TPR repeat protein